ncbi:MAG: type II toxin-antitoxin system HicA family toxin [Syntrophobacteraceae bacterium]
MNRQAFIREPVQAGCFLKRHGGRHDIYMNPKTGKRVPVPCHTELKESPCDLIRKQLEIVKK